MATRTKGARPRKPRTKETVGAAAKPAEAPLLNTNFICAACERKRPSNTPDGKLLYATAANNDRICHKCIDERDTSEMAKGGITLSIVQEGNDWYATNASGKLRFKLLDKGTPVLTIGNPTFVAKGGGTWSGRLYPKSGMAHFQLTDPSKPAKAARTRAVRTASPGRRSVARTEPAATA